MKRLCQERRFASFVGYFFFPDGRDFESEEVEDVRL